ncbi:MAG TPA: acyltransferase [Bacteroidales bacterium]|nr:acyltransferase [Bacteroidales bacterium]
MIPTKDEYDKLRPYYDEEVNSAIGELIKDPEFAMFIRYLLPGQDRNEVFNYLRGITSIEEFQRKFVVMLLDQVTQRSIDSLTCIGTERIEKDKCYIFMSNHRDIVLDSSLINLLLLKHGFNTSQIAIGGNLLISPMITNLVRINKSFIVKRDIPPRELYEYSKLLSSYIAHTLFETRESVWIAQREGRAKDGNDKTQYGLLKMLAMNYEGKDRDIFLKLNIFPVALSYEYDPCDMLKAIELYSASGRGPFVKSHQSDFQSMITGIMGYKGRVDISFSSALSEEDFDTIDSEQSNNWMKGLAAIIDKRIYRYFKLWDTNYIAHDLLNGKAEYIDKYTEQSKNKFVDYLNTKIEKLEDTYPKGEIFNIILNMYANPLKNKLLNNFPV